MRFTFWGASPLLTPVPFGDDASPLLTPVPFGDDSSPLLTPCVTLLDGCHLCCRMSPSSVRLFPFGAFLAKTAQNNFVSSKARTSPQRTLKDPLNHLPLANCSYPPNGMMVVLRRIRFSRLRRIRSRLGNYVELRDNDDEENNFGQVIN